MNDRTIWIFRIIAVFILLLFAYLMLSLYSKLRRMQEASDRGSRTTIELQIADRRQIAPLPQPLSPFASLTGRGEQGCAS